MLVGASPAKLWHEPCWAAAWTGADATCVLADLSRRGIYVESVYVVAFIDDRRFSALVTEHATLSSIEQDEQRIVSTARQWRFKVELNGEHGRSQPEGLGTRQPSSRRDRKEVMRWIEICGNGGRSA